MYHPIYLDNAATTPTDKIVCDEMLSCLSTEGCFGNPDSINHSFGLRARDMVEKARFQVANFINCEPEEIIFTSGATESNNFVLRGVSSALQEKGNHIITVKTEHKSILTTCSQLEREGFDVTYLQPQSNGLVTLDSIRNAITPKTILVSIMHVNNELGIIQNINEIGSLLRDYGIAYHVDAAQSIGKLLIDLENTPVNFMSLSAHKIYGPKGIGALYIRNNSKEIIKPLIYGGNQENGFRAGTLATHQIVGMGKAFVLAKELFLKDRLHINTLSNHFCQQLVDCSNIIFNHEQEHSIPDILNFRIVNIDAKEFFSFNPNIAASVGSACTSRSGESSHVLRAIGLTQSQIRGTFRISLGRFNTMEDINIATKTFRAIALAQMNNETEIIN
jgi:cysteine desulfurase